MRRKKLKNRIIALVLCLAMVMNMAGQFSTGNVVYAVEESSEIQEESNLPIEQETESSRIAESAVEGRRRAALI